MSAAQPNSWKKSSRSKGQGKCVEVSVGNSGLTSVRDSKDVGPQLGISNHAWSAFIQAIKDGKLDLDQPWGRVVPHL